MIAVSRCITLVWPEKGKKIFSGRNGKLIILSVWIYAILLVTPMYISKMEFGTFGYNCKLGKCDFISLNAVIYPRVFWYSLGFSIPCLLTVVSYTAIWWHVTSTSK